jgi:hypothetical protein
MSSGKGLRLIVSVICLLSFALMISLIYRHIDYTSEIYASKKAELKQLTVEAAGHIESILRAAMTSAENLAGQLTNGRINKNNMQAALKRMLVSNDNYYGATITFAPFRYDPKKRLYSIYYSKSGADGKLGFQQIGDIYDYTTSTYDWYVEPMAKGNRWSEPYWDEAGKTYMTTYSALFYQADPTTHIKTANGVVTIDIRMDRIRKVLESLDIGPSGFGALTTRIGTYLYHPDYEYVLQHKNIREVAQENDDNDRLMIADKILLGESGIVDHVSITTSEKSWLIFQPIPISGWSLQNTFIKSDLNIDVGQSRQQLMWILIDAIVFAGALTFLLVKVDRGTTRRVWIFTAVISCLLVVGIGVIWDLALTYHSASRASGVKVSDRTTLSALMNEYRIIARSKHLPQPTFIPTGLYIDTMEFTGANDLLVAGRLWQKYPEDYSEKLGRGVQFGRSKSIKMDLIEKQKISGSELMLWRFQADLRVDLDYSRYPLEVENLAIQLLPQYVDQNLVLVPDLDAYKLTTPTLLPGLDRRVFIPGWKIPAAFFLLRPVSMNSDFGVERDIDKGAQPTLYYEVGVKRVFIDAFISNLTPLIVVSIVLFSLVLLSKKIEIGKILSVCVALFFVVVFSHLDIRKNIAAGEIFYLEYFFFVTYLAIILVPMDAIRYALGMRSNFYEYRDGLLASAIYWPTILGIFFVITAIKFY